MHQAEVISLFMKSYIFFFLGSEGLELDVHCFHLTLGDPIPNWLQLDATAGPIAS